ncbi:hypothetical protein WUBG_05195 [Wuchereria bancrofti]|nr:hypothetical protein WUBG_05195 [Wuchereria bancrofti]
MSQKHLLPLQISKPKACSCTKTMQHSDHRYGLKSLKNLYGKKLSGGISQRALDDTELRHRSTPASKKSRLPMPNRLVGYLSKSSA